MAYDQDSGINQFELFVEDADLERLSEREWLKVGLPDGITLTAKTFDALQEYAALSDDEQEIMLAYYEVTDVFDFEETQDCPTHQLAGRVG